MTSNNTTSTSRTNRTEVVNNVVFQAITTAINGAWTGTMTDLTRVLRKSLDKGQKSFMPRSPAALRVTTNRIVNRLRKNGVSVKFTRTTDHMRTRLVSLKTR